VRSIIGLPGGVGPLRNTGTHAANAVRLQHGHAALYTATFPSYRLARGPETRTRDLDVQSDALEKGC
jgi:hypothetical protein